MTHVISMKMLERKMDETIHGTNTSTNFYRSIEAILKCIDAIVESRGAPSWAAIPKGDDGQPLILQKDQAVYEKAIEPLIPTILALFNVDYHRNMDYHRSDVMVGGQNEQSPAPPAGIDELYGAAIDKVASLNAWTHDFASKYGILGLEKKYEDEGVDPHPFEPLKGLGAIIPPAEPALILASETPVPIRTLVFVGYLTLDIIRLMIGVLPTDTPLLRKMLSMGLAVIDLMQGNWKKALLSFAGFYGQNYIVAGVIGKVALDVFYLISPDLRETILFGSFDVAKSILAGTLLAIFQTFATADLRAEAIEHFNTIDTIVSQNNKLLVERGLQPMPTYLAPSFQNIQNIQAALTNPNMLCSPEFQGAVRGLVGEGPSQNIVLKIALQLLRVPVDEETLNRVCGDKLGKSFTQSTVESQEKSPES